MADATQKQKWPGVLWIVRHAESAGNLARDAAEAAGEAQIRLGVRDVDVPLSPLGQRQAESVGRWFGALPENERPTALLTSPFVRARETARLLLASPGAEALRGLTPVSDERLREREFGILDGLTHAGIVERYPAEAVRRAPLGKFYYRPPGGESWCDVILRLRSVLDTLSRDYRGERVILVCHTVVVFCFRYLLERMSEQSLLEVDRSLDIANCSITSYRFDPAAGRNGKLVLDLFNFVAPLEQEGTAVTAEPPAGPGKGSPGGEP